MSSPPPNPSSPATPQGPQPNLLLNYQPASTPDTVTPTRPLDWRYPTWILAIQLAVSSYLVLRHTYLPSAYYFGGISLFIAILAIMGISYLPLYAIHLVLRKALRNTLFDPYWHYVRTSRVLLILAVLGIVLTFKLPLRLSFLLFSSEFDQLVVTYQNDPTIPLESHALPHPLPGGPVSIGPYRVTGVSRINGGVLIYVDSDHSGFAYVPAGSLWGLFNRGADGYLGGGWWYFIPD